METQPAISQGVVGTLSWGTCYQAAGQLWMRVKDLGYKYIYGVPRGGCTVATMVQSLAHRDGKEMFVLDSPNVASDTLVVDDIIDSGSTLNGWHVQGYHVESLFRSLVAPDNLTPDAMPAIGWVTFPWEVNEGVGAEDSVVRLLQYIGEDTHRDGLLDTPKRVLKAWKELTRGYQEDPKQILSTSFEQVHDELVLLRGVEFHSTCEHHMLPFYGTAAVGYIPTKSVVGISKLARLVDCFAKRLQIQERLTSQIAQAITEVLKPVGVGVVLKAKHACMGCRGVMKPDADMVTSVMLGALREDRAARAEFLALVDL